MSSTEYGSLKEIEITRLGKTAYIELSSPENQNMLTLPTALGLLNNLRILEADPTCKIVVLEGKGNSFCAGTSPEWQLRSKHQSRQQNISDAKILFGLFEMMHFFQKPIISSVTTNAEGTGVGLLACSDIVVAEEGTTFCLNDVSTGVIPSTYAPFLVNKTGLSFAKRMMLTCDKFTAQQAYSAGLVTDIVPRGQASMHVEQIVEKILSNPQRTCQLTKQMLNHLSDNHEFDEHMAVYCVKMAANSIQ
jgi:methylglutaconyl-CoA hydratase